jgi:hypothetical protein
MTRRSPSTVTIVPWVTSNETRRGDWAATTAIPAVKRARRVRIRLIGTSEF